MKDIKNTKGIAKYAITDNTVKIVKDLRVAGYDAYQIAYGKNSFNPTNTKIFIVDGVLKSRGQAKSLINKASQKFELRII